MPKVTTPLLVEDFYKTTLTADVNASGDIELEVSTPPLNKKGFIIVDPESNTGRERMYYHDVIGNIIYVKGVNRIDPKEHFALDKVQINDTSLIFNYLSKALSTTFFVEQLTSLGVKVFGGPILKGITTVSVSDTELTMIDGVTNYIYYKASTNEIKSAISEVTVGTDKGIIVADLTTASGIITSINYRHHGLFIGRDIESITKTNTTGLVDTYTILYSDQTTSTFYITNGSSIANIAKTDTTGLVDTYTVTLTNGNTTTFEVTNGNGIEDISYTSSLGLVDTYTITFQDGTTSTFDVENGADGADGNGIDSISKTGSAGLTDIYTIYFTNGGTSTFTVTNGSVTPLQVQNQSLISVDSTGTSNNYILNISPTITNYTAYQKFTFKANFTNTGASTVNINGLGVKSIKKYGGTEELSPGDIKVGQNVEISYDGISFQLINIGQIVNGQNLTKSGLIAGEAMSALQVYRRGKTSLSEDITKFYLAKADNINKLKFEGIVGNNVVLEGIFNGSFEGVVGGFSIPDEVYYTTGDIIQTTSNGTYTGSQVNGQTFTVPKGKLNTIKLSSASNATRSYKIVIKTAYGGTILGESDTVAMTAGIKTFTFATPIELEAGTYYFEFTLVSGSNVSNLNYQTSSVYSGGSMFLAGVAQTYDLYFEMDYDNYNLFTIGSNLFLQNDGTIGKLTGTNNLVIGRKYSDTEIELTKRINGETSITATTGSVVTGNAQGYITINIPGLGNKKIPYWGV